MSAGVPSHRRAESWTQTSSYFRSIVEVPESDEGKQKEDAKWSRNLEKVAELSQESEEMRWLVQARTMEKVKKHESPGKGLQGCASTGAAENR